VLAIHARAITEFGGVHGVRDEGALEAALTAAEYRTYYEQALLTICAATYAYHLPKPTPSWMATSALPQPWQKSFLN
jgi:death-on-curing protein